MNLYLIGYRGSGKSTVGVLLSKLLKRPYWDTDELVEGRTGQTIQKIFLNAGEDRFRKLETEVIKSFRLIDCAIVSLGGGAVLAEENRSWLRATGRMVWLVASPETLFERISRDPNTASRRPHLTDLPGLDEVRAVLSQRDPIYSICADFKVDVESLSATEVAASIAHWWSIVDIEEPGQ